MDCQSIIEIFFTKLGRFDFDSAKTYIDQRKDLLQRLEPTFPNHAQLMAMLFSLSHMADAEKNYHNQPFVNQAQHSFLPTANFLRKARGLKDMYNDIYVELQQLEQMEKTHTTINLSSRTHDSVGNESNSPQVSPQQMSTSTQQQNRSPFRLPSKPSTDSGASSDQHSSNSSSTEKDSPSAQVPQSPGSAFRNTFFRVLSPMPSSSNQLATLETNDPNSLSSSSGYEPPPNSTTTTPVTQALNIEQFSEQLVSHICKQLQNFIQARMDMVDVYEKLTEASSKKYAYVDSISFRLSMLCRQYQKYFHHPLLAPIKEGMTLECESLMTLIRATIDMQHWRFLPALFDLQDAQTKLNYWAASTFNKETSRKRFKVKTQAPRLYSWLCRFKEFLLAKFTLYFHTTLSRSIPPAFLKNYCSKLTIDYYAKLSSFQRKVDALFVALMYDVSNERDFRGLGYSFPSKDYQQPQGKNTLQCMVIIPADARPKLNNLQAEIYMIVTTNQQVVMKEGHYQFHDNIKKLTYSITKPDSNVILVTVCEGHKAEKESQLRSFSQEIIPQFAMFNMFTN